MLKKILLAIALTFPVSNLIALDTEFQCLANNVYHEARGESKAGKIAVALVTLNRVESDKFPKTICGVVYQRHQFSWTTTVKKFNVDDKQWRESVDAAMQAYMNRDSLGYFKAKYFHAKSVNPWWKLHKVATIGQHVFYK